MKNIEIESSNLMQSFEDCEVPEGWLLIRLRDDLIINIQPGFACGINSRDRRGIPHLRPMNVTEKGQIDLTDLKFVPESECSKPERFVHNGDIIFNNTNSPELVGKTAYYSLQDPRAFSNHMTRLRCNTDRIDPVFCAMVLHQQWREGYFKSVCNNHVSQSSISRIVLLETPILLPPLAEQLRIVARVEALLSQVNAAQDRLNRVPLIMKRFRQAVLAAACSGRLTEGWREEHPDISPASDDIENLLKMREDLWRSREMKKNQIKFDGRGDVVIKKKYKPPFSPKFFHELPETWLEVTISQLCFLDVGFAFRSQNFLDNGIRLLRGENIEPGTLRWKETKYLDPNKLKGYEDLLLDEGEIILGMDRPLISNGLKIATVKKEDTPALLVQRIMRFKMVDLKFTQFVYYNLLRKEFVEYLKKGLTGSDLPHITGTNIAEYCIGFPPVSEQYEIALQVDSLFSLADKIEREVADATKRTEALTQAILAKAFRGKLVDREAELVRNGMV
jgi:type I restriction enzyme, S subunit